MNERAWPRADLACGGCGASRLSENFRTCARSLTMIADGEAAAAPTFAHSLTHSLTTHYSTSRTTQQADYSSTMPLLKIFSRQALRVSADVLHPSLQTIWNVPADVLKVLVCPVHDMSGAEDIYVDVRAKAKPERTQDVVDQAMADMKKLFSDHGYSANIRVELYEPSLQSALKP